MPPTVPTAYIAEQKNTCSIEAMKNGATLAALKAKGLSPESTEKDEMGQFAHFHDPDGNKVSIWGK